MKAVSTQQTKFSGDVYVAYLHGELKLNRVLSLRVETRRPIVSKREGQQLKPS
jgi:hypothetical protein